MRITLIQQEYKDTKQKTIEHTLRMIKKSKGELVILQELHQNEYFCKSEDTKYFDYAESFEDDVEFWRKVSEEQGIVLVTSLFEKVMDGIYYNTAVVFDKGKIAGKYRKNHIPDDPGFYEKFYFTPGDEIEPIDTSVGRLGVLVCWDQWYPEAARIMALKGAEVLIYPTAIGWLMCPEDRVDELCEKENTPEEKSKMLNAWLSVQRGHAVANGVYVIAVNRVGKEKDQSGVLGGIEFWGNSFIYGPQGEEIYKAGTDEEIIEAEINLKKAAEVRKIWPFFRDRRIENYSCLTKRYC
ncbi:putative N-carbamoylputrescine amidohydrolase [Nautilia profundicola AmH]|uniref:N-carbamoylputrescine amidohydrolase n=1 Tax=Nautilia profundicola (strain ATCC BAA-1463 / DSM 18972 / AmH) TaxID=598659 RepID=B9L7P3_NAUPA|nr:carbon-nitrogen hydrolase [Nautilia profundicola]ACM93351.1 putative N-carbamoylputrescine amidohydrolase [Nautilia profundicola AmH]